VRQRRYRQAAIAIFAITFGGIAPFACTQPVFNAAPTQPCSDADAECEESASKDAQTVSETGFTETKANAWFPCSTSSECNGLEMLACDDHVCSPECTMDQVPSSICIGYGTLCVERAAGRATCGKPCFNSNDCQSGTTCFKLNAFGLSYNSQYPQLIGACATSAPFASGTVPAGGACTDPDGGVGSGCTSDLICVANVCRSVCVIYPEAGVDSGLKDIPCDNGFRCVVNPGSRDEIQIGFCKP